MTDHDHDKIAEMLSAYVDGELSESDRQKVDRALADDADLAAELGDLRAVRATLRSLPRMRAGDSFVPAVLAKAERPKLVGHADEDPESRAVRWVRHLATAAILLLFVSLAGLLVGVLWQSSDVESTAGLHSGGPKIQSPDHATNTRTPPTVLASTANNRGGQFALHRRVEVSDVSAAQRKLEELCLANGIAPADLAAGQTGYYELLPAEDGRVRLRVITSPDKAHTVLSAVTRMNERRYPTGNHAVLERLRELLEPIVIGSAGDGKIPSDRDLPTPDANAAPEAAPQPPPMREILITLDRLDPNGPR